MYEVTVAGESTTDPSVRSDAAFQVDAADVSYSGASEGRIGEPTDLRAMVANRDDAPVVGVEVTFEVDGVFVDDSASFTALTDANGVATTSPSSILPLVTTTSARPPPRFGRHAAGVDRVDYRVLTAGERVERLRDGVAEADLQHGIEQSLTAKLEAALERLDADDPDAACEALRDFGNEVEALRGRHVPEDSAEASLHETGSIRAQLDYSA